MSSILKNIGKWFNPKTQKTVPEMVYVAAFGKHSGWDDHIDDIGLETDLLVAAKRIIYIQGIGGNIDSGSWDKLPEDQRAKEFKHELVWSAGGNNVVVGRMWSSQDGKGRKNYPMLICVQCIHLPIEWIVKNILSRLKRIEEICAATTSASYVRMTIENAQSEFRRLAQEYKASSDSTIAYPDALARLAENPEMGPNHEGLIRILYHIEREVTQYHSNGGKTMFSRPVLLRVPVSPLYAEQDALLWSNFLQIKFGIDTPVLVLIPEKKYWIDVIIGQPTESQLYCLRALLKVIPPTSSIPYNMEPEFVDRTNQLIMDSKRA